MAEDKIADLQRRLDEKLVNPNDLSPVQREALNTAFEEGTLKGYRSVNDMVQERRIARKDIAEDVRQRLEPLAPTSLLSLGIRRGTLAAAGDIVGSFTPYVMDGKKLAAEAREAALAGKSVSYIPKIKEDAGKKSFETFSNLISKLPGLKQFGVFKKTGEVLDAALNSSKVLSASKLAIAGTSGVGAAAGYTAAGEDAGVLEKIAMTGVGAVAGALPFTKKSQLLKTEIKSQLLGAAGASAGSVTYDVINLPAKFASAAGEDISKYDQNQLNRLPFLDRTAYHAVDNFKTALMWNAGTFGLFSLGSAVSGGLKNLFRLNPANQAKANQLIDNQGLPVSTTLLAEGTGGASNLYKNLNRILSVLPPAAGEPLKFQQRFTGTAIAGLESNIRQAVGNIPLLHTEVLARAVNSSIRQTFEESGRIYTNLYANHNKALNGVSLTMTKYTNELLDAARKQGGFQTNLIGDDAVLKAVFPEGMDIPFIATNNLRSTVEDILGLIQRGVTKEQMERRGYRGLYEANNDVTIRYASEILDTLNDFRKINGGDFLTPAQFTSLRQGWNANYPNTKFNDPTQMKNVHRVLEAFEKDFNFVNNAPTAAFLFEKNQKLGRAYEQFAKTLGPEKANKFLNEFKENVSYANDILREANYAFGQSVNFYNFNKLAREARRMDPAMLTSKQGMDFFQEGKVTDVQGMNRLFKSAFDPDTGTSEGIEDLFKLIGGSQKFSKQTQEQAQYVMKLLLYRKAFDSFNKNAVSRLSGVTGQGVVVSEPFVERGITTVQEAIEQLNKKSPLFRKTVQELIEKDMKLGSKGVQLAEDELINYQRRAITPQVIRQAIKDEIPINQTIFVTREAGMGETVTGRTTRLQGFKTTGREPLQPYQPELVGTIERVKQAQIVEKGVLRDVTTAEREAAQAQLENIQFRLQGYQGFKFDDFAKDLGLTSKSGEQQLIKSFELANGISNQAAKKHVDNIKDIIEAMKRNYTETPVGDAATYLTRAFVFAGAATAAGGGFLSGGFAGGLMGTILSGLFIKFGSHLINSPKFTKTWLDLYSTGERMGINKIDSLLPKKRALIADLINYNFRTDPDAPKVNPNNIDEQAIIKYLQGKTLTSVPTDKGIYDVLPEEIKNRFNPERLKLKDLRGENKKDFNTYLQGRQVAKFREDLIDNLDTEQGMKIASQPRVAEFIQNPMDLKVPEGAKTMQPNINQVTADVYSGLFPGDSIGTTIAQSQQAAPPMMKKGGFVNAKTH